MRLFLAVWLNQELRQAIHDYLRQLSLNSDGVRWVRPEQFHVTLQFLGEQPAELIPRLNQQLIDLAAGTSSFQLGLGAGGCFPERGTPRVLWLGLTQGATELSALAKAIGIACANVGMNGDEKPFKPHLTLGRVKTPSACFNQELLRQGVHGNMLVTSFSLVESVLKPSGSIYQDMERFDLKPLAKD